jgi:hypothetical protein
MWISGGIAPLVLNLDSVLGWVVNFAFRPLYPHRRSPPYPLYKRLGGSGDGDDLS